MIFSKSRAPKYLVLNWARRSLSGLISVMVCSAPVFAQNVVLTGALSGRATDPTGAPVSRASVVARSIDTGVEHSAETSSAGIYHFPVLAPGKYSITASLNGFRNAQGLVQVLVGNTTYKTSNSNSGPPRTQFR